MATKAMTKTISKRAKSLGQLSKRSPYTYADVLGAAAMSHGGDLQDEAEAAGVEYSNTARRLEGAFATLTDLAKDGSRKRNVPGVKLTHCAASEGYAYTEEGESEPSGLAVVISIFEVTTKDRGTVTVADSEVCGEKTLDKLKAAATIKDVLKMLHKYDNDDVAQARG